MAKHEVRCLFCGETFDTNTTPFIKPRSNRYAHKVCPNETEEIRLQKKNIIEEDEFWAYVKKLYGPGYNYVKLRAYAEKYIRQFGFTWTGMLKALTWYYDIKGNPKDALDYETLGILPYVYEDAKKYYYNIYLAQKKNENVKIDISHQEVKIQCRTGLELTISL